MNANGRLAMAAMALSALAAPFIHPLAQRATSYDDVAPILAARCVLCHAGDGAPLGLRFDSYDGVLKGSANGPVVKAGDAAGSELIKRLKGISQPRMPMTGPPFLTDAEIAQFESWVERRDADAAARRASTGAGRGADPVATEAGRSRRLPACRADLRDALRQVPYGERSRRTGAGGFPADLATNRPCPRPTACASCPGRPNASELLRRIRGQAQPRMPMDGPPYLSEEEIGLIEAWIAGGARNAEGQRAEIPAGAKVRLHGTLEARWRLESLNLDVGGKTRIDKEPDAGDYVEVRGRLDTNGNVIVERIRPR